MSVAGDGHLGLRLTKCSMVTRDGHRGGAIENAGFVLWHLTGSDAHVTQMKEWAANRKLRITDTALASPRGKGRMYATEKEFFAALGLAEIPPELREGRGEIERPLPELPELLTWEDITGVLHCHTTYSDGGSTIEEMADAARERGWSYLGVSDHSEAAFYAGGLKRDKLKQQHDEIDEINSRTKDFRVLKGIEADILADGRVDYSDETLDTFDYVIGSVHSRFSMDGTAMTERVLAMDDPRLTILGHATGTTASHARALCNRYRSRDRKSGGHRNRHRAELRPSPSRPRLATLPDGEGVRRSNRDRAGCALGRASITSTWSRDGTQGVAHRK